MNDSYWEQRKTLQHTHVSLIYIANLFISVTSHLECNLIALGAIQPVLKPVKTRLKLSFAEVFLNWKKYFSTHHKHDVPGLRSCPTVTQS